MIGAKAILFIAVSMVNFCKIDQPTPDVIQFSQGDYGEGSLQWTYFPGIEDSTFVALELMNILNGYPQQDEYRGVGPSNKGAGETLHLPGGDNWTIPKSELKLKRGTSTSLSPRRRSKRTSKAPKPCQPHEEPRAPYKTVAAFPLRSAVWMVMLVENLAGLLLTWHAERRHCHVETGNKAGKKKRRVAMLEGQVVESLPRAKLRDDSCVIVNLSPSNSNVNMIDEDDLDDESFHML